MAKNKTMAGKEPGMYWRADLGRGSTVVVGPRGYRGYETETRQGWTTGQDNQGRRWTSGTFLGQEWTDIRKK